MTPTANVSRAALAIAVVIALLAGVLASLAIRPPGKVEPHREDAVPGSAQPPLYWRVPSAFGSNLPLLGEVGQHISTAVDAVSGGSWEIEVFDPGELVPALNIAEAVGVGKVPAGFTWTGYDQGRIPAAPLIGAVPFGMEPWEFLAWWYDGGGRELGYALYESHGVVPVLCGIIGPETAGWFRTPIGSVDDLRGLKIRFSGLGGQVLQALGASVTVMPGSEIFQALEKGALDATEFSQPVIDAMLGFDRVARYNYYPGWHQPFSAFSLMINRDVWSELPSSRQAQIEAVCRGAVTWLLARSEALQGEAMAVLEGRGVEAATIPDEVLIALRETARSVLETEARKNTDFARILASQRAFQERYAQWRNKAYPPSRLDQ